MVKIFGHGEAVEITASALGGRERCCRLRKGRKLVDNTALAEMLDAKARVRVHDERTTAARRDSGQEARMVWCRWDNKARLLLLGGLAGPDLLGTTDLLGTVLALLAQLSRGLLGLLGEADLLWWDWSKGAKGSV